MALPLKNFQGEIDGKIVLDFVKDLDYSLNIKERMEVVKKMLDENDFFREYYENYFKVNVNKEDFLSLDINISKALEKLADYIMFDKEHIGLYKKTKYVFTSQRQKYNIKKKELSLNPDITPPILDLNDFNKYDTAMYFYNSLNRNYKLEKKQEILAEDIKKNQVISEYNNAFQHLEQKKKNYKLKKMKDKKFFHIVNQLKLIKEDMVYSKNILFGTIWFKHIGTDSSKKDLDMFSFSNKEHVKELLRCSPQDLTTDIGVLVYDFEKIMKNVRLSEKDKIIIGYFKDPRETYESVADKMGTTKKDIFFAFDLIARRVIKEYKRLYEDWIFTYLVKGEYKKCSKCGETKLISRFRKRSDGKGDGFRAECRLCEAVAKSTTQKSNLL